LSGRVMARRGGAVRRAFPARKRPPEARPGKPAPDDAPAPPGRRRRGAAPPGVRPVRGVRRPAGLALAPAGRAPPAGGGVGGAGRVRRPDLSAHPARKPFAPRRGRGRLHRRPYRSSPLAAARSGRLDPRGAVGAGGGRPDPRRRGARRPVGSSMAAGTATVVIRIADGADGGRTAAPILSATFSASAINRKVCRRTIGRIFFASCLILLCQNTCHYSLSCCWR